MNPKRYIFLVLWLATITTFISQAQPPIKDGAILAAFSVSDSTKVYFSQGNLQYQASSGTWRFAEHQWDEIGTFENKIIENRGYIDLFQWGTIIEKENHFFYEIDSIDRNNYVLIEHRVFVGEDDFGILYNVCDVNNKKSKWRMLTIDEWMYLLTERDDAIEKIGIANVNITSGFVLLPDRWKIPAGLTFRHGFANDSEMESSLTYTYRKVNNYSIEEWEKMETNGAVFLPCSGYISTDGGDDDNGNYWCYSIDKTSKEYVYLWISVVNAGFDLEADAKMSVRLVQDVKK
ncbi:MAG: hypothetical protein J6V74_04685 [Bacteroidales bacterium]|nr:hypothetical protein [Bacteroidales bacterium]